MRKLASLFLLIILLISCKEQPKYTDRKDFSALDWEPAREYYLTSLQNSIRVLEELKTQGAASKSSKDLFEEARVEFKKAEPYASYLNPPVGHRVNGPALPIFKEDNSRVMPPIGLQKIEESIYGGDVSEYEFQEEMKVTIGLMRNLEKNIQKRELNPERFFIATHQQLLRILTHSISGFDTPASHLGINEAAISLSSLKDVYQLTLEKDLFKEDPELDQEFKENVSKALRFIEGNSDFENFDRYTFIREHLNKITANWVKIRKKSDLWNGTDSQALNFDAPTFFEEDSFNTKFFMQAVNRSGSDKKILLGEKFFYDKALSKNGTMSCATCHAPEKAFADGMQVNLDNAGKKLKRNTPTLINAVYQKSFFWDGRSEGLMEQISSVFNNEKEFNTGVHQFSDKILQDSTYTDMFKETFGFVPKGNTEVVKALSSYIATLTAMNSKFDKNIRAEEKTFTAQEKKGFNLFMGKALCATCHFMPHTNGTVPPFYAETEKEVIGVPETDRNQVLDDDTGFFWQFEEELHRGMFKTPTVRNVEVTAPYMHNGVYNTLAEVVDFYNKGGGAGLGFDVPHQTLPFDELDLSTDEQEALIAYMKTLTDTKIISKEGKSYF